MAQYVCLHSFFSMFSIIIPTFNNINYLKLCLKSIEKNSKYSHEIVIHINEGSDGTFSFLKDQNFLYTYSEKNKGVCFGFNEAVKKANTPGGGKKARRRR